MWFVVCPASASAGDTVLVEENGASGGVYGNRTSCSGTGHPPIMRACRRTHLPLSPWQRRSIALASRRSPLLTVNHTVAFAGLYYLRMR